MHVPAKCPENGMVIKYLTTKNSTLFMITLAIKFETSKLLLH